MLLLKFIGDSSGLVLGQSSVERTVLTIVLRSREQIISVCLLCFFRLIFSVLLTISFSSMPGNYLLGCCPLWFFLAALSYFDSHCEDSSTVARVNVNCLDFGKCGCIAEICDVPGLLWAIHCSVDGLVGAGKRCVCAHVCVWEREKVCVCCVCVCVCVCAYVCVQARSWRGLRVARKPLSQKKKTVQAPKRHVARRRHGRTSWSHT